MGFLLKRFVSLCLLLSYLLASPGLAAPAHPWPPHGRVVFFSLELSGNSQVTLARIQVPNPAGALQPRPRQLRVFPSPILHDGAASYLWKQTSRRQFRWVLAGLQPGDQVVVAGAYLLESEHSLRQGGATDDHMSGMAM